MNIYVIYKDGEVVNATTLPRVVMSEFKRLTDTVQVWRNDKLIGTFTSLRGFNKFINPQPTEDDETGGNDYEW